MGFYTEGRKASDFDAGVRRALTAVLPTPTSCSHRQPVNELPPGTVYRIDDLALASRLSFFLWSSLPDDQLLDLATAGKLREPEELQRQVKRMLADPRSITIARNFGSQWLNLTKLPEITPDPAIFPYASGSGDLRGDFRRKSRCSWTTSCAPTRACWHCCHRPTASSTNGSRCTTTSARCAATSSAR